MKNNTSAWLDYPNYQIEIKSIDKRIVVGMNNTVIVDSSQAMELNEQGHETIYYFPEDDIQMNYFEKIDKETFCPFKGHAKHWSLLLKSKKIDIAAWCYEQPFEQVNEIKNYIAFYPEIMQHAVFY